MDRKEQKKYAERLFRARMRLMKTHSFYALLSASLKFGLDEQIVTAATNGEEILFAPRFLDTLSDSELSFILLHEISHVALRHHSRGADFDKGLFNVAADIVINSTIYKSGIPITVGGQESMHLIPDGREGHLFTTEEVYHMLQNQAQTVHKIKGNQHIFKGFKDNHETWNQSSGTDSKMVAQRIETAIYNAARLSEQLTERGFASGSVPLEIERMILSASGKQKLDWKTVLHDFVQINIADYTFSPPDRRFSGQDFFFPALVPANESISDILFMIDTSGSVSDDELSVVFNEMINAINQFDGHLACRVGFFDTEVKSVEKVENIEDVKKLKPKGYGGTDFACIFDYIKKNKNTELPKALIVLTDGYSQFPPEKDIVDIPILWILTGKYVNENIPYGRVIKTE